MTSTSPRPLARPRPNDPPVDRRLAAVHLRMGQLELARAELEALAGAGQLDDDGLLALSEARWRTGDLTGAGEAAQAYLAGGRESVVALVIAAEATAAVGKPAEARKLAGQALEKADVPLDRIFAGIPRSMIWPADPSEAGKPAGTLFPAPSSSVRAPATGGDRGALAPVGPGVWGDASAAAANAPDAAAELAAGKTAIAEGRHGAAAIHLALALRLAAGLAPAVLDVVEGSERRTPALEIVRGDAYRLGGHEVEARRAYEAATAAAERIEGRQARIEEDS
ncbi:MAG: tetratricopeptide repeat protein [Chloroflexota bacterium]